MAPGKRVQRRDAERGKPHPTTRKKSTTESQRGEAAIKEELKREIRQRRENAEIRAAVFRIFGVFRGSVLREILAACEQLRLLQCRERKNLDLKKFAHIASFSVLHCDAHRDFESLSGRIFSAPVFLLVPR